jgi:hypothetical protein
MVSYPKTPQVSISSLTDSRGNQIGPTGNIFGINSAIRPCGFVFLSNQLEPKRGMLKQLASQRHQLYIAGSWPGPYGLQGEPVLLVEAEAVRRQGYHYNHLKTTHVHTHTHTHK